jgi:ribosomal protein S18 acetylase RimI-like enzyme
MLTVRGLTTDEWAVLREVRLAALTDSPAMFGSNLNRELGFDEMTWRARTATTALAWDPAGPVGIVGWVWQHPPGQLADLVSMWVGSAARGRGVGTALVRWVIDEVVSQRGGTLELGVVQSNSAGLGLYRRLGFVPIGSETGTHSGDHLTRM